MFLTSIFKLLASSAFLLLQSNQVLAQSPAYAPATDEWTGWGGNSYNNRWNSRNSEINSTSFGQLVKNCQLDVELGILVPPTVIGYVAYFPTANGSYYAYNYVTCQTNWIINVVNVITEFATPSSFAIFANSFQSRTSAQVDKDNGILYFATQINALLVAADVETGQVLGVTQVNPHPLAIVTQDPTLYNGVIFVGGSSGEEFASSEANYTCCSFQGNFAAYTFERSTGFTRKWNVPTLPPDTKWSGAAVWGSQPSIDPSLNTVFFAAGNSYTYPPEYEKCKSQNSSCLPADVYQDSVVAVDIATGTVNWKFTITPMDAWVFGCSGFPNADCPSAPGPDADFPMAPIFVPAALGSGTTGVDSIVVGQKNGNVYSIRSDTGALQWLKILGSEDTSSGWLAWGLAADDKNVFYTLQNEFSLAVTVGGTVAHNSLWGALSLQTGAVEWEIPLPNQSNATAPPTVVNDLFLGTTPNSGTPGTVYAISKSSGQIIDTISFENPQPGGVVATGGFLLFGSGDYRAKGSTGSFYVYGLPSAIASAKAEIAAVSSSPSSSATSVVTSTTSTTATTITTITTPLSTTSSLSTLVTSLSSSTVIPVLALPGVGDSSVLTSSSSYPATATLSSASTVSLAASSPTVYEILTLPVFALPVSSDPDTAKDSPPDPPYTASLSASLSRSLSSAAGGATDSPASVPRYSSGPDGLDGVGGYITNGVDGASDGYTNTANGGASINKGSSGSGSGSSSSDTNPQSNSADSLSPLISILSLITSFVCFWL